MATKHMNAAPGDFASTVLMPGDPLRAEYIAETYLEGFVVRNMWGFTGEYKGMPVSIMAHSMGIPSVSIYCSELITEYGVKRVVRVGSCGTSHPDVKLRTCSSLWGFNGFRRQQGALRRLRPAALATFSLVEKAVRAAQDHGVRYHVGNIFSTRSVLHGSGHVRHHGQVQRAWRRNGGGRHLSAARNTASAARSAR